MRSGQKNCLGTPYTRDHLLSRYKWLLEDELLGKSALEGLVRREPARRSSGTRMNSATASPAEGDRSHGPRTVSPETKSRPPSPTRESGERVCWRAAGRQERDPTDGVDGRRPD